MRYREKFFIEKEDDFWDILHGKIRMQYDGVNKIPKHAIRLEWIFVTAASLRLTHR